MYRFKKKGLEAAISSWVTSNLPKAKSENAVNNAIVKHTTVAARTLKRARQGNKIWEDKAREIGKELKINVEDPEVGEFIEPSETLEATFSKWGAKLDDLRDSSIAWHKPVGFVEEILREQLSCLDTGCILVPPLRFSEWVKEAYETAKWIKCTSMPGFESFWDDDDPLAYGTQLLKRGAHKTTRIFFVKNFEEWVNELPSAGRTPQQEKDRRKGIFEIQQTKYGVKAWICETEGNDKVYHEVADDFSNKVKSYLNIKGSPFAKIPGTIDPDIAILPNMCDSIINLVDTLDRERVKQRIDEIKEKIREMFLGKIEMDLGITNTLCDSVLNLPFRAKSEKELQGIFFLKDGMTGSILYDFYEEQFDKLKAVSKPWKDLRLRF